MLKIIGPKEHCYYRSRIDLVMGMMQFSQNISLSSEEQDVSPFIIGEDENCDVYGGAVLYKKSVATLHDHLKGVISAIIPQKEEVWGGSLSLFIDDKMPSLGMADSDFYHEFYKNLLEEFISFGEKEGVRFLCLTLDPLEYLRTKKKGLWPYILEVTPQHSLDGLFHGILSLSKRKPAHQSQPWQYVQPSTQPVHLAA